MKAEEYKQLAKGWTPSPFNFRGNPANKAFVQAFQKENNFKTEGEALDYIMLAFQQADKEAKALTEKVAELESTISNKDKEHAEGISAIQKEIQQRSNYIFELQTEIEALKANGSKGVAEGNGAKVISTIPGITVEIGKSDFDIKLDALLIKYKGNILSGVEPENVPEEDKAFMEEHEEQLHESILHRLLASASNDCASALLLTKHAEFTALREELEVKLPKMLKVVGVARIPVSEGDMLRLLVDYCKRDPSQEFPFLPIAKEIFEKFKASENESRKEIPLGQESGTGNTDSGNQTGDSTGNTGNESGTGNS